MKTVNWSFRPDNVIQRFFAIWDLLTKGELSGDKLNITRGKAKQGGEKE